MITQDRRRFLQLLGAAALAPIASQISVPLEPPIPNPMELTLPADAYEALRAYCAKDVALEEILWNRLCERVGSDIEQAMMDGSTETTDLRGIL